MSSSFIVITKLLLLSRHKVQAHLLKENNWSSWGHQWSAIELQQHFILIRTVSSFVRSFGSNFLSLQSFQFSSKILNLQSYQFYTVLENWKVTDWGPGLRSILKCKVTDMACLIYSAYKYGNIEAFYPKEYFRTYETSFN